MNQSEQINELMTALAKAQGEMSHATKDSLNPHFKAKFADLASVWVACREPLSKHGLAVTQTVEMENGFMLLVTTLGHSSGQWIKSCMILPQTNKPQEMGSLLTYYRRYSLAAMVGVYQDDDDAETAQKPLRDKPAQLLTESQCNIISACLEEFPEASKWIYETFKVEHISQIEAKHFQYLINVFNKKRMEQEKK